MGLDCSGHVGRVEVQIIPVSATATVTGVSGTTNLGNISVETNEVDVNVSPTGVANTGAVGDVLVISDTFAITVSNPGSGNKFYIDGVQQATVSLTENNTYRFDQSDSSNGSPLHPLRFSTCLLYTSPSPRDRTRSRMPSSA